MQATIKEFDNATVYVNNWGVVKAKGDFDVSSQEWTEEVVNALEVIADYPASGDNRRTIVQARKADMDEARQLMLFIETKCRECAIFKQTMFYARAKEAWVEISRNYRDVNPIVKSRYTVRNCWQPIAKR